MITDIITSGAMHSIKTLFHKKKERNVIIDPFSCLIKLSLLRFLEPGTKISIYQNRLFFNSPSFAQGLVRFVYGDGREDLHNLYLPIQKCVEWFWNDKNQDMTYLFNNAVIGLKLLKNAYSTYATIQHTLDYYIIILMQKNNVLISKLGINSIDIEKITNNILDTQPTKTYLSDTIIQNTDLTNKDIVSKDITSKEGNGKESKKQNKQNKQNRDDSNKDNFNINKDDFNINKEDFNINKDDSNKNDINNDESVNTGTNILVKDMHKFLVDLWNEREINIVINMFREIESKNKSNDRDYIFNNVMSYCEMKENKLYKYIEDNASIL